MKYCTKCGHQMADDMLFCQKCGAKSEPVKTGQTAAPQHTGAKAAAPQQNYTVPAANTQTAYGNKKVKIRKGMKVGMIICFVFAAIYGLISIAEPFIFAMTPFFFVLGLMFLSLGLVPKESKYMYLLGKPCKLKKSLFVVISIIVAFVISEISMSINPPEATTDNPSSQQQQNNDVGSNPSQQEQDDTSSNESKNDQQSASKNTVVLDVEKYGNISADELVALVGEPDEISQSTCQGAFDIPCVYYEYNNADTLGEVSFVLVNNQVVRFTSYSEYPYESKDAVLAQFGITKESSCAIAADTNVALRYRCPSAKVDDFWINLIDGDTFEFLQITYDMEYYEEWYLPLTSSEVIEYKTDAELTMKSLLTSPKTADFPWYDWEYGKNLFYILVSSYVDAENAFGAEMRNTFTFVYSRLTGEIVLAIVNDEVVANNGYVAVDELVQQLYDEMKKAADENKQPNNTTQSNPSDKDNSSKPNDSQSGNSGETPTTQPNK